MLKFYVTRDYGPEVVLEIGGSDEPISADDARLFASKSLDKVIGPEPVLELERAVRNFIHVARSEDGVELCTLEIIPQLVVGHSLHERPRCRCQR